MMMENIFGGLLEFQTTEDFEAYLASIEKKDAIKLIELALYYGQKQGLFSFSESHCLYVCINKLKQSDGK